MTIPFWKWGPLFLGVDFVGSIQIIQKNYLWPSEIETIVKVFFRILSRDSAKSSQKGKFKGFLLTSVIAGSYKEFILINHHTLFRYIPCSIDWGVLLKTEVP